MPVQFVKEPEEEASAAAQAVELYNEVEQSEFTDRQRNLLNKLVAAATGYVQAGYEANKQTGEVYVGKPEKGATDGKPKPTGKKGDTPPADTDSNPPTA